jgi:hypothetical protein
MPTVRRFNLTASSKVVPVPAHGSRTTSVGYRLAHGSYKSMSWSRDLCLKWLGLLAHYVSDVEIDYLPKPMTPGPSIDYVHQDSQIDGMYAATLMISAQIKPVISKMIERIVTMRFAKQDGDLLLEQGLFLYGTAKLLQKVGEAQIALMDQWLDESIIHRGADRQIPRGENRDAGVFRDFYDYNFLIYSPEPLGSLLRGFHTGVTYVNVQRFRPSFAEFKSICNRAAVVGSN